MSCTSSVPAWVDVKPFFPDAPVARGGFVVERFRLTKALVEIARWEDVMRGRREHDETVPGEYIRLVKGRLVPRGSSMRTSGECVMSDLPMEKRTCLPFLEAARGDVLVAGLGLGLVLLPAQAKAEVRRIVVVEKSADVIALVARRLPIDRSKVVMVRGDVFCWRPPAGERFDVAWFDIWSEIGGVVADEIDRLRPAWAPYMAKGGRMLFWRERDHGRRR